MSYHGSVEIYIKSLPRQGYERNRYAEYAKTVDVALAEFVKDMHKFYDSYTNKCSFGPESKKKK
jgi:hypothetical protein